MRRRRVQSWRQRSWVPSPGVAGLALGSWLLVAGCLHEGAPRWHRVATGETLSTIAARYRVGLGDLVIANAVSDPNHILAGDLLLLPAGPALAAEQPSASPRATAPPRRRSVTVGPTTRRLPPNLIAPGAEAFDDGGATFAWPVSAPISSRYGRRDGRLHEGIDLLVPDGTEVRAAAAGEVVYAGDTLRGYGNLVILRHPEPPDALPAGDVTTVYAHNSTLLVHEGEQVARGQAVALSGHSGRATAPHVHFELRFGANASDPEPWLSRGDYTPRAPISEENP